MLRVIEAERAGKFGGQTVQVVPHVTGAIQDAIESAGEGYDVHIVEIGGTVGDYESLSFIEAIREFSMRVGRENCLYVHVVYMPYLGASKEFKTKPAQNSVREIRGLGIAPDILVCRSEETAPDNVRNKLSLYCGVTPDAIALLPNAQTIYQVPLTLEDTGIADVIAEKLHLKVKKPDLTEWRKVVKQALTPAKKQVRVGIVAKYLDNADTYMSVTEALRSAGWANKTQVAIEWLDAEKLEKLSDADFSKAMNDIDGILVPGGFGSRGIEGKIRSATFALDHKKPYLGLCYGMHMLVIASARRAGLKDANTTEIDKKTPHPVIATMAGQEGKENTGGTMRLGDYACHFGKDTLASKVYGTQNIVERHRHRFEANGDYVDQYEAWGIRASGMNPNNGLVEVVEGIDHPYMMASQYHPELKSRPNRAHPMFFSFIRALQ